MELITVHDDPLIRRIASEDRHALMTLYERHRGSLIAYLRLFIADQGLIEEVVQDTMLAAWKGAGRFAGRSSVRSWLFAIARRRANDVFRRNALPVDGEEALWAVADPKPRPESWTISQASQDELIDAISGLSQIHKEVLMLVFVHELSYQETADVIGIPLGTVKSRLSKARQAARTRIGKEALQ